MEQIKPGQFKYGKRPVFVKWPATEGEWHVWGPESEMVPGSVAEVYQHSSGEVQAVEILEHVAERLVLRRGGDKVRFVLATFDGIMEE
jgi:hypothetical protein